MVIISEEIKFTEQDPGIIITLEIKGIKRGEKMIWIKENLLREKEEIIEGKSK